MRIPIATYRLQLNPAFRFAEARAVVPYLARLGISDIYASPILRATPGSTHGYDVTSPDELNPELGTWDDFQALIATVQAHQMGWLQDIVPNHMAYAPQNGMLMDLLENGPQSPFYHFFDIFRDHPDPELQTKVLAPFLGSSLEEVLKRGEMKLVLDAGGLALEYFTWRFPLYLASYDFVLRPCRQRLSGVLAADDPAVRAFVGVADAFARLSSMDDSPEKRRQLAHAREALARLHADNPLVNVCLDATLDSFNRPAEEPVEQSPLSLLLDQQMFKPVFWQVAYEKINYRRFFYLSEFIALRAEDPTVFRRTHDKILEWTRAGLCTGLRIDHLDGLHNPRQYLVRLRQAVPDTYLVVEKILELGEFLRTDWPIQGTSGYKFCNYVNGIFCARDHEPAFTGIYHEFLGAKPDYEQLLYTQKRKILEERMAGEVAYLAHLALQASPGAGPATPEALQRALTALMAAFPVYRTYVDPYHVTEQDRMILTEATEKARARCPEYRPEVDRIVRLLRSVLESAPELPVRRARQYFLLRFQQFTGPAMAKGFEDTLLYVYNRFLALNEVGGDPHTFGLPLDRFHDFNQTRARHWPHALNATSTHDSKRGEDARARLNVLSEMPERWRRTVTRWAGLNERHKQPCGAVLAPDRNDEYLLYQTLVGVLPFEVETQDSASVRERVEDYLVKAVREAKTHSNWVQPNEPYEAACRQFVDRILDPSTQNPFRADFLPFQQEVAAYGIFNSLSQTVLKMTCPGLPDFYQGAELWDFNLVDPDNRRPVDFEKRASLLAEIVESLDPPAVSPEATVQQVPTARPAEQLVQSLLSTKEDGRIKLFLIYKGLQARRDHRELFEEGDYLPASVAGSRSRHVVAFFRVRQDAYALVVVPRFVVSLVAPGESPTGAHVWENTRISLPAGTPPVWQDALTGSTRRASGEVYVADLLATCPVSILVGGSGS
jgi:(1->4)-alpha-D-glucan 1-alpha-D-glucosylmutase